MKTSEMEMKKEMVEVFVLDEGSSCRCQLLSFTVTKASGRFLRALDDAATAPFKEQWLVAWSSMPRYTIDFIRYKSWSAS